MGGSAGDLAGGNAHARGRGTCKVGHLHVRRVLRRPSDALADEARSPRHLAQAGGRDDGEGRERDVRQRREHPAEAAAAQHPQQPQAGDGPAGGRRARLEAEPRVQLVAERHHQEEQRAQAQLVGKPFERVDCMQHAGNRRERLGRPARCDRLGALACGASSRLAILAWPARPQAYNPISRWISRWISRRRLPRSRPGRRRLGWAARRAPFAQAVRAEACHGGASLVAARRRQRPRGHAQIRQLLRVGSGREENLVRGVGSCLTATPEMDARTSAARRHVGARGRHQRSCDSLHADKLGHRAQADEGDDDETDQRASGQMPASAPPAVSRLPEHVPNGLAGHSDERVRNRHPRREPRAVEPLPQRPSKALGHQPDKAAKKVYQAKEFGLVSLVAVDR